MTRNDRNDYIDALEVDDDGDLNPLVAFTARRQRLGYWLSVIGISVAILALGATELVLFVATAIYLLVAALRMRDMGNNP